MSRGLRNFTVLNFIIKFRTHTGDMRVVRTLLCCFVPDTGAQVE